MASVRQFSLIAALLLPALADGARPPSTSAPDDEAAVKKMQQKLEGIIIPQFELHDASLTEAVDYLRKEAQRRDPQEKGVSIILQLKPSAPAPKPAPLAPSSHVSHLADPPVFSADPIPQKITLSLTNVPLSEALKYVAGLVNMQLWVKANGARLVPLSEPVPMLTHEFAIRPDFFRTLEEHGGAQIQTATQVAANFQKYLIACGVIFPNGAKVQLNAAGTRLIIRNTKDQLDLIETTFEPEPGNLNLPTLTQKDEQAMQKMEQTLDRIVIPRLKLKEVTLSEALDLLRKEARHHDPQQKGIPIILQFKPPGAPGPVAAIPGLDPAPPSEDKITLSLSNISLHEALKYVTGLANAKFQIDPDKIRIVPATEPDPLFAREFVIPTGLFASLEKNQGAKVVEEARKDFQEYLVKEGVLFPEHTSARLDSKATRLTVQNTREQLQLIDGLLQDILHRTPKTFVDGIVVPGPEVPKAHPCLQLDEPDEAWQKKLNGIVLHDVALNGVTLHEAVEKLQELSTRQNRDESDRHKRGIRINIEDTAPTGEESEDDQAALLSYATKEASFLDALKVVAKLGGRTVRFGPDAISLGFPEASGALITGEYLVPPGLERFTKGPLAEPPPAAEEKNWLLSSGVEFDGRASAIYISATHRLVVRDSPDVLRSVQHMIEEAWTEYYRQHPPEKKAGR